MEKYFNINERKLSIRCKLYAKDQKAISRVILFGHGFGGHKDNKAAETFANRVMDKNKGAAVVTFDLPGHGDDARKPLTLSDCGTYLEIVTDHIQKTYAPEGLDAYATSFGGYLLLKYIAEHGSPFSRIALRCPAVPMYESLVGNIISENERARLAKGKPVSIGFDRKVEITQGFLEELKAADLMEMDFIDYADDILILHGTKDEVIPIRAVKDFADNNLIDFIPVENADHRFSDPQIMKAAVAEIVRFLGLR